MMIFHLHFLLFKEQRVSLCETLRLGGISYSNIKGLLTRQPLKGEGMKKFKHISNRVFHLIQHIIKWKYEHGMLYMLRICKQISFFHSLKRYPTPQMVSM